MAEKATVSPGILRSRPAMRNSCSPSLQRRRLGVELQHDVFIDQRVGAVVKAGHRPGGLRFERPVVRKFAADGAHLDQPRIAAAGEKGHGSKTDLARLIAADGCDQSFGCRRKRLPTRDRKIGPQ
jgi:hypothetical protein